MSLIIINRDQHTISRKFISRAALKVLYRLHHAGFDAYLVGGSVRDLLLKQTPKDFDVVTNAMPEEIKALFRNCRLIGRRFRLAHILFGNEIIEVATFRGNSEQTTATRSAKQITAPSGMILKDNLYGTIEEDASRRDFSVNSLYYNIADYTLRDYVGGITDLTARKIRLIGDPYLRYAEDPVRMLRAIRFAVKLDMSIETGTVTPLKELAPLLIQVSPARLLDETLKLFLSGHALSIYHQLVNYHLFPILFPFFEVMSVEAQATLHQFLTHLFSAVDQLIKKRDTVTPSALFAAILWYPVSLTAQQLNDSDGVIEPLKQLSVASSQLFKLQTNRLAFSRYMMIAMREIWMLQLRFKKKRPKLTAKTLAHPQFTPAYWLLTLREAFENNQALQDLRQWWEQQQLKARRLQHATASGQHEKKTTRMTTEYQKKPAI